MKKEIQYLREEVRITLTISYTIDCFNLTYPVIRGYFGLFPDMSKGGFK